MGFGFDLHAHFGVWLKRGARKECNSSAFSHIVGFDCHLESYWYVPDNPPCNPCSSLHSQHESSTGPGRGPRHAHLRRRRSRHYAAECRSRVNQVSQEDDAASVQTRATTSSTTTASTAASSANAQVWRVHVVDLEQLDEDQEVDLEFLCSVRMVQEVDSEDGFELPCSSVQCFTIGNDSESDQPFAVDLTTDGSSDFAMVWFMFVRSLLIPTYMKLSWIVELIAQSCPSKRSRM